MTFDHYIGFETYVPKYFSSHSSHSNKFVLQKQLYFSPIQAFVYRSILQRVSFFEFWKTRFIFRHTPVKKFISRDYIYYKYRL